jgi:hypothetical protein
MAWQAEAYIYPMADFGKQQSVEIRKNGIN